MDTEMLKKYFVAILPVLFVILWYMAIRLWLHRYSEYINIWVLLVVIPQSIGAIVAFIMNLLIPVSTNLKKASQVALISMFALFLFFIMFEVISFFVFPVISVLETIAFSIWAIVIIYPSMCLLFMGVVALGGRFGARIRLGNKIQTNL